MASSRRKRFHIASPVRLRLSKQTRPVQAMVLIVDSTGTIKDRF